MPANQQVALEREQQDLELELEEAVVEQQRKPKKDDDMIGRYHMVRFFGRALLHGRSRVSRCVTDSMGQR